MRSLNQIFADMEPQKERPKYRKYVVDDESAFLKIGSFSLLQLFDCKFVKTNIIVMVAQP